MMRYKVTTEPLVEPVSLTDMKSHLRVDISDEDSLIKATIKSARIWCEDFQNRAYITRTITLKTDDLRDEMPLPRPELQSVSSVKYIDTDGAEQTLSTDIYDVDTYSTVGKVVLAYNQSWPSLRGDNNGVEIVYVAGYGDAASDVPDDIRMAIKLLAAHWYEHRETVSEMKQLASIPIGVENILWHKRVNFL